MFKKLYIKPSNTEIIQLIYQQCNKGYKKNLTSTDKSAELAIVT